MKTLQSYLRNRLIALGLIISIPITILTFTLYDLGLDDSTELYLQQDIKWAKSELISARNLPKNNEFKQFYLGENQLPTEYLDHVNNYKNLKTGITNDERHPYVYWETPDTVIYGLTESYKGDTLYVFHHFLKHEELEGIQLETVVALIIFTVLTIMLIGSFCIYRKISSSMSVLNELSKSNQTHPTVINPNLKGEFSEVHDISNSINRFVGDIQDKSRSEQYFIQSLSHELRTPMAIIQAAIEVLRKQSKSKLDPESLDSKLNTIFSANLRMQALSDNLLSLWSGAPPYVSDSVSINTIINGVLSDLSEQYTLQDRIQLVMPTEAVECKGTVFLVATVITNLIKNAIVHGVQEDPIKIIISNNGFEITNTIKYADDKKCSESVGIGLFIVERAIEHLTWKIKVTTHNNYQVSVCFNKTEYEDHSPIP